MKELFIIRHAKSSWEDASLADYDRPLNKRGLHDAPMMAQVLKEKRFELNLIISSTANRAKSTAQFIAHGIGLVHDQVEYKSEIYGASFRTMMNIINLVNDRYNRIALVGHNPTFTYLAERLGGESIGNLPTCGIVGLRFNFDSWKLVSEGTADQFYYDYPKMHK